MGTSSAEHQPPPFVRLASHPIRWCLLRELVRSDRAVSELTALVGEPQNLVSYHLRLLREAGLVRARQSSADRRDTYYSVDLQACRDGLQETGAALHPSLQVVQPPIPTGAPRPGRRPRLLFVCTGNSSRSQIAEALAVQLSGGAVEARSAGSNPKPLHPNAVRVLRTRGIDISHHRSTHVDELSGERFDEVITLCDRVREVCPDFPSRPSLVHWSLPDPALAGSTNRASYPAFERTADELATRIGFRIRSLLTTPPRRSSRAHR